MNEKKRNEDIELFVKYLIKYSKFLDDMKTIFDLFLQKDEEINIKRSLSNISQRINLNTSKRETASLITMTKMVNELDKRKLNHKTPLSDKIRYKNTTISAEYAARRKVIMYETAHAIPSNDAIEKIISYDPVCEIGAGTGFWASLIDQAGGDIIAYEKYKPGETTIGFSKCARYFDLKLSPEKGFIPPKDRTLMLCWPPHSYDMGSEMLKAYQGGILIYIGESKRLTTDPCTGTPTFFEQLKKEWRLIEHMEIPRFQYVEDCMEIYERK